MNNRNWYIPHGSQEPPVPRLLMVSAAWKHLGSVGRDVPLRISECFWKYMPRSQTFIFAIARLRWGLNQALTPSHKGKKEILKWKQKNYSTHSCFPGEKIWLECESTKLVRDLLFLNTWVIDLNIVLATWKWHKQAFSVWKLECAFSKTKNKCTVYYTWLAFERFCFKK